MDCAGCAAGIERALHKLGLPDASVNFATRSAYYTPAATFPTDRIVAEISKLGYTARVKETGHEHHHEEDSELGKKALYSAILTAPLLLHMVVPSPLLHASWFQFLLATPVVILGCLQFGRSAIGSLRAGFPNMDVLIMIGVIASYGYSLAGMLLGLGNEYLFYETAATIITLVFTGNYLEHRSVRKAGSAIEELSRTQVTRAKKISTSNGTETITEIPASEIVSGDRLRVNTGDQIPADGEIADGDLLVDESILTGESLPLHRSSGMRVIGGSTVHSGTAIVVATEIGERSVLGGIVRLVREAQGDKPSIQKLGDIVSAYFTPVVITIALLSFLCWYVLVGIPFPDALLRSVAVLVIACPCAMGLATPTAIMVGIGRAAKRGILFRGGTAIERLAKVKTVVFDKTGTLTTGEFRLGTIEPLGVTESEVRSIILGLERHSSHPIARSLVREIGSSAAPMELSGIEELKGFGISGTVKDGARYSLGAAATIREAESAPRDGRLILARNGEPIARIKVEDSIKPGAVEAVAALKRLGISTVILSGDTREKSDAAGKALGIDKIYSEQSPAQKLEIISQLQQEHPTAFVGDGVNDAPALAKAGVGISMSDGTHLAIQSSDVVLLNGSLDRLVESIALARATVVTIKQNLFWAFSYNVVAIPVAAMGMLNPMVAAFTMGFSDVMTIGNSLRLRAKTLLKT